MIRRFTLAASLLAFTSTPAFAQFTTNTPVNIEWNGTVQARCNVNAATTGTLVIDGTGQALQSNTAGGTAAGFTLFTNVPVNVTFGGITPVSVPPAGVTSPTYTTTIGVTPGAGGGSPSGNSLTGPTASPITYPFNRGNSTIAYNLTVNSSEVLPAGAYTYRSIVTCAAAP
jgi:hypothetical protein